MTKWNTVLKVPSKKYALWDTPVSLQWPTPVRLYPCNNIWGHPCSSLRKSHLVVHKLTLTPIHYRPVCLHCVFIQKLLNKFSTIEICMVVEMHGNVFKAAENWVQNLIQLTFVDEHASLKKITQARYCLEKILDPKYFSAELNYSQN